MRIQNNGLGVQSTTIYLLAREGMIPAIDHSIFADVGEEPQAVYTHLKWLQTLGSPPLIVASRGKLGDALARGVNATGQQFASIPAYTAPAVINRLPGWREGSVRRQCTREYKIEVVERVIRRQILGLKPRQRIPRSVAITQVFGISWDERLRALDIQRRFDNKDRPLWWTRPEFPLLDRKMTRADCKAYLAPRVPHEVPRSACVFCPYRRAAEWLKVKADPADWARAVQIDTALRTPGIIVNRNMDQQLFLHRTCLPIVDIDFEAEAAKEAAKKATPLFDYDFDDCGDGMCGV